MRSASVLAALTVEPGFAAAAGGDRLFQIDLGHAVREITATRSNHDLIHDAHHR